MLTAYVHDLDPVLISFSEFLKVRWYGLAYLAGFIAGWWFLKKFAERKLFPLAPDKVSDFIAYGAFLGVFLGGRLGYVLFYMLPSAEGRARIAEDPLTIIKVWDGGMASHGGIIGLTIFCWFYARRTKVSWAALGDGLVCVAPLGVFFGRVANFINGELYGHVAKASWPWLVKFPGTIFNPACEEAKNYDAVMNVAIEAAQGESRNLLQLAYETGYGGEQALATAVRESDAVKSAIEPFLQARHPSQLYEGILEGLLLFALLTFLRLRYPKLPKGRLTGLFFLLYAGGRIFVEQFRVPDSSLIGIFTKGQFYSLFFIAVGVAFLLFSKRPHSQSP
ncbi:prolipoprotein diacylglyceryl transferase [Roseibacillus ishigakijimensis]|uniref:Phosphatidylglycerol--prolipoprotein diacylglyceryl transferase n=1 Tax=Roseibacillus ishigakijimensis TaxID=454146 RepID=A0A934RSV8_9BACT|nr:prolipoprotein diacylglyceryl transferase [Roseibacillus ishigakijimensis]MBK1834823.1 prolipoprotein diacylglyceryl transferase [Roseibacillus ishigakijimensis]